VPAAGCEDSLTRLPLSYPLAALVPASGSLVASPLAPLTPHLSALSGAAANPYNPAFVASAYNLAYRLMGVEARFFTSTLSAPRVDSLNALSAAGAVSDTAVVAGAAAALAAEAQVSALLASGAAFLGAAAPSATAAAVGDALASAATALLVSRNAYAFGVAADVRGVLAGAATALGAAPAAAALDDAAAALAVWQRQLQAYKDYYLPIAGLTGSIQRDVALDVLRIAQAVALQQSTVAPAMAQRAGGVAAALSAYSNATKAAALVRGQTVDTAAVLLSVGVSAEDAGAGGAVSGVASLAGALSGCQGAVASRFYELTRALATGGGGAFTAPSLPFSVLTLRASTCTDTVTGAPIAYAHALPVPRDASELRLAPISNLMQGALPTLFAATPLKVRAAGRPARQPARSLPRIRGSGLRHACGAPHSLLRCCSLRAARAPAHRRARPYALARRRRWSRAPTTRPCTACSATTRATRPPPTTSRTGGRSSSAARPPLCSCLRTMCAWAACWRWARRRWRASARPTR